MVDQVDRLTIQDGISGPMKAAEDQLRRTADAADVVEKTVTRVGASAKTLVNRYDDATRMARTLEKAQRDLANAQETLSAGVATGTVTQEQANNTLNTLAARVGAARSALQNSGEAATRYAGAHNQAAQAARALSVQLPDIVSGLATGQGVMQIAIQQGQQVAGSFQAMGISARSLVPAIGSILSPLVSLPGALAVGAAGLGVLAYNAETAQRDLLGLQATLRASRDDYAAMATEAEKAARAVAATSGFGVTDARSAAASFAAQPAFQGSSAQLQNLVRTAGDLSTVLGVTLPAAAEELARAMSDPAAVAEQLAKQFGGTVPQATVDMIRSLAAGGDTARAFAVVMGIVQDKTHGAAEASKTELQKALDELGAAFVRTDGQGKSFVQTLGEGISGAAASAVSALASVVRGIENMWESATRTSIPGASAGSVNPVVVGPDNRLPTAVSNEIYRIAEARNFGGSAELSALQADFATRLTFRESGGRQFGPDGRVLTSSAGALGTMQVMPGNAGGNDLSTQSGNITAGLKVIADLWTKYDGNPGLVAMAYNWGPTRVDALLDAMKTTGKVGAVPDETRGFVKDITGRDFTSFLPGGTNVNTGTLGGGGVWDDMSTGGTRFGVVNTPGQIVNEALQRAGNSTPTGTAISAQDDIKLYTSALAELAKQGDTSSASVAKLREALQTAQVAFYNAVGPAEKLVRSLDMQVKGELAVAAGWANGAAAADHATNAVKAQADALTFAAPGTKQYADTVAVLTSEYDKLSRARQEVAAGAALFDQGQQLQYLQVEAQTIGMSEDARNRTLAAEKERQAIAKNMPGILEEEKDRLVANAVAIADATTAIQRQQRAIDELGNVANNVFSQLSNAITQAFVSGSGSAVNLANIAKAAIATVGGEALKLGVINPVMNSAFGGSRATLSDVLGAAGGGASGGASGFGLNTLSNLYSLGKGAYGVLTGDTPISLGALGDIALWGGGSTVAGVSATPALLAGGANGMIAEGAISSAGQAAPVTLNSILGTQLFGSATIGSALTGVGAGFGVGSVAGGLVQGALNKTGPAPTIGAGVGAAAGAAIGSIIPGVGTILGGIIGGLIGGGGGGLIGPKAPSAYSSTGLTLSGGRLSIGGTLSQIVDPSAEVEGLRRQVDQVNQYLSATGVSAASAGYAQIGQNTPGGFVDPTKFVDLFTPNATGATAFSRYRFSSGNEVVNRAIDGQSFNNLGDLSNVVNDILKFVNETVPALKSLGDTTQKGSATTALETLNQQFSAAIDKARGLGMATDDLSTAWDNATGAVKKQVDAQARATDENLTLRYYSARATNTGSSADALGAQLLAFDTQAAHERETLSNTLKSIWGDAIESTTAFADQMALLERTLGEERLSIAKQYNERLSGTAANTVGGLADYAGRLATSSASPLSPMAQYTTAAGQFNAITARAASGDFEAINNVASASDAFLAASRAVNGSGAGYAADYRKVLDILDRVSQQTPDALTASVLQAETRTQTQVLSSQLAALQREVVALRQQVAQSDSRPR